MSIDPNQVPISTPKYKKWGVGICGPISNAIGAAFEKPAVELDQNQEDLVSSGALEFVAHRKRIDVREIEGSGRLDSAFASNACHRHIVRPHSALDCSVQPRGKHQELGTGELCGTITVRHDWRGQKCAANVLAPIDVVSTIDGRRSRCAYGR